ncbi:NAD(P)H nitroreductase [Nocardia sp.]|uniref:Acg family FMN-binding oxidoreductase n=1 Tax=Nocardia sp. TaxID=1821 RepID=UPI00258A740E|nr:NAD(P)H nitroreductase [Nocardia sp.]
MRYGMPDERLIEAALTHAARAPSVGNIQPWRFRVIDRGVHLYLDRRRVSSAAGSDERDLLVSCGAVLHHARVAFASLGWSAVVERLPDQRNPDHLAVIDLVRARTTPTDTALGTAITRRRTDQRPFSSQPVPPGFLGLVSERAAANGAMVHQAAHESRRSLVETMYEAERRHGVDRHPRLELAEWSGRYDGPGAVSSANSPPGRAGRGVAGDIFSSPGLGEPARAPDYAELLVVGTTGDDRRSRLRAGEAASAVLLTATNIGLSSCLLTEPLAVPDLRQRIRTGVLAGALFPQVIIRVGWQDDTTPLPAVPRHPISEVLAPADAPVCGASSLEDRSRPLADRPIGATGPSAEGLSSLTGPTCCGGCSHSSA